MRVRGALSGLSAVTVIIVEHDLNPDREKSVNTTLFSRILIAASVIISTFLCVPFTNAQFDLTVTPAKIEIEAMPGETIDFSIELYNQTESAVKLTVYPMDYYVNPDNSYVFEKPGHYTYSCASWIGIENENVEIPALQMTKEPFSISVPEEAEPGGHYGVIFFQEIPESDSGQGAELTPRIGALVLLTVPGEIVREGRILNFGISNDLFSLWSPPENEESGWPGRNLKYRVEFENQGNVHLTTIAEIRYWSRLGFGAGFVELGPMTVLPGTVRYYEGSIPNPPSLGIYKAEVLLQYGPNLYTFDTDRSSSSGFLVIPVLWIVFLLMMLLLLWKLIPYIKKRFRIKISFEKASDKKSATEAENKEVEAGDKNDKKIEP